VNVIRINANGIGFSTNGYNGPFNTAWTLDGNFVADFITTGTLNANLIKTGVLADTNNNTMFNLSTGALTMKKGSINLGNGVFTVNEYGGMHAGSASLNGNLTAVSDTGFSGYYRYAQLKDGNLRMGMLKDGTYTEYGAVYLSVPGGTPTGDNTNILIKAHSGEIQLEASGTISLKSDNVYIKNGTYESSVCMPITIGAGGVITSYRSMKIVSGILMND
jgi:hypothetical protein